MNAHIHRSNLFLTYPTQTPLLHSGSRSVFPAVYMCTQKNDRIYMIEFLKKHFRYERHFISTNIMRSSMNLSTISLADVRSFTFVLSRVLAK